MKYALIVLLALGVSSAFAEDFEMNSTTVMDAPSTGFGTPTGWGTHHVFTVENDSGNDLAVTELGFSCGGPSSEWYFWLDVGGWDPPAGDWTTADYTDSFTPTDPDPEAVPDEYSYIDVTGESIVVADGAFLCFGYMNPGSGGINDYAGYDTWTWWSGGWDPDAGYDSVMVMQIKANFSSAIKSASIGEIKASFK
jgi:hypothetical protein